MSRENSSHTQSSEIRASKQKLRRQIVAGAAAGLALLGVSAVNEQVPKPNEVSATQLTPEKVHTEALASAKVIEDQLNDTIGGNKTAIVSPLKGVIELPDPLTSSITLKYHDVFVLALANPTNSQKISPDLEGKFLDQGWIGLQTAAPNDGTGIGKISIALVKYDAETMHFVPATTDPTQLYQTEYVKALSVRGGPGFDQYMAEAVNPQTLAQLTDTQGQPVIPGYAEGMK